MGASRSKRERSSVLAALAVCAVVLAGCSGFAGQDAGSSGGSGPDGVSAGVTPAPVPTTEGTETPAPQVAPGLATTGVENASALAAAHERALANASVTIRRVTTYRYGSGEIARREIVTTRIGPDGSRLRVVEEGRTTTGSSAVGGGDEASDAGGTGETTSGTGESGGEGIVREVYWFGANRSVRALTYANGTTIYEANPPKNLTRGRRAIVRTEATRIDALASGFETRVSRVENGSDTRYRVTSVSEREGGGRTVQVGFVPVSDFSLVVGSRGFVEQYRLVRRLSVQRRGKPTEIVTRVRYTNVGETRVERPPWYERAVNTSNARTTNASAPPTNRTE